MTPAEKVAKALREKAADLRLLWRKRAGEGRAFSGWNFRADEYDILADLVEIGTEEFGDGRKCSCGNPSCINTRWRTKLAALAKRTEREGE